MNYKICLLTIAMSGFLAQPTVAATSQKPLIFDCEFRAFGSKAEKSFIPKKSVFVIDTKAKKAKIGLTFDGSAPEKVFSVTSSGIGGKVIELTWSFNDIHTSGLYDVSMDYIVRLNTTRNTATIRAWPRGFDNDMRGEAKCALRG